MPLLLKRRYGGPAASRSWCCNIANIIFPWLCMFILCLGVSRQAHVSPTSPAKFGISRISHCCNISEWVNLSDFQALKQGEQGSRVEWKRCLMPEAGRLLIAASAITCHALAQSVVLRQLCGTWNARALSTHHDYSTTTQDDTSRHTPTHCKARNVRPLHRSYADHVRRCLLKHRVPTTPTSLPQSSILPTWLPRQLPTSTAPSVANRRPILIYRPRSPISLLIPSTSLHTSHAPWP